MPNPSKGARLYLRTRKGRPKQYVIRDGSREIITGCGADDVRGANEALAKYIASTYRPNQRERDLDRILCSEVLTLYLRELPENSPTRATIGYHAKALLGFWGDKTLADVRRSNCKAYVKSRPVKASTARQELKTFQAAINFWHTDSPLEAVPKVTLPDPGERRERVLERYEAAAMLRAARRLKLPHVARFILIGIYTGTRHDAILKLRWEAGLSGGHIDLSRGVLYRRGAGERETSKRRPPVSISGRLFGFLQKWYRHDADGELSHVIHYHGQPIAKMKRAWNTVRQAAGLGPDVTPHTLRHTCASWLLWEGRTIWEVGGIIGADASTVERVYGHHQKVDQPARQRA